MYKKNVANREKKSILQHTRVTRLTVKRNIISVHFKSIPYQFILCKSYLIFFNKTHHIKEITMRCPIFRNLHINNLGIFNLYYINILIYVPAKIFFRVNITDNKTISYKFNNYCIFSYITILYIYRITDI